MTGQRRDRQRRAQNRAHAKELLEDLLKEYDKTDGRGLAHESKTFKDLADHYEKHYAKEPEYVDGRKVAGLRSLATVQGQLKTLRERFGNRRVRPLSYGDIRAFRADRLNTPTSGDVARHQEELKTNPKAELRSTRAIASVNRELALLRRMLNVAQREGWIAHNPFGDGESLISLADERKRERIITRDEEKSLLAACDAPKCKHLRRLLSVP